MQLLKADTSIKVIIGPVVAVGDGFVPITTLAISSADEAEIMKHDASAVTDISGNTFAAITSMDGYYNLTITAGQLDTEGMLTIGINDDSLCLPVRHDFMVVNANVYDSLYGAATTDYLQVDTIQVGGVTEDIATETKQDIIDTNVDQIETAVITNAAGVDVAADIIALKAETALIVADTNELQSDDVPGLIATAQSDLDIITGVSGVNLLTATQTSIDAIETDTGTTLQAELDAIQAAVITNAAGVDIAADIIALKAETVSILADTNELQSDDVPTLIATAQADLDIITDADGVILGAAGVDLVWDEVLTGGTHNVVNSSGRRIRQLQDSGAYDGGFLYIDTTSGTSGTTNFENYTVTNAGTSLTEANTVAASIGSLHKFQFSNDSSWTLIASQLNSLLLSSGATLALGGQDLTGTLISGFFITGVGTTTGSFEFFNCDIGTVTLDNDVHIHSCGLEGTLTIGQAGQFILNDCYGTTDASWILDYAALGATVVHLFNFNGDVTVTNLAAGDTLHITGNGVITTATCTGGIIEYNGAFRFTDAGGNVTEVISDTHVDIHSILADTGELQTDWVNGGRLDLLMDRLITEMDTATTEPGQGAPPVSTKRGDKIDWLYKMMRNRSTSTATTISVYNDDATTVDHKITHSDDATTYDRGEMATGP